jgi:D-psicose/D-tagatose/L-ribulose 3-epimerase
MKVGFNLLLWTTHVTDAHAPVLEALKEAGYDGVEVPVFEGTPDHYAAIGRRLADLDLGATTLTVIPSADKNPLGDDAAQRWAARDYLDWAMQCTAALGANVLCGPLHSTLGHFTGRPRTDTEWQRALDFHRDVGARAQALGVRVAIEAINRFECYFLNTTSDLLRYLEALNHPAIAGMYDTFHAHIEEKNVDVPIGLYGDRLIHVHISENDRGTPGTGQVRWPETFRALKASGYDGWLTVEAFGRALPELAAATRIWRDLFDEQASVYRGALPFIRDGWRAA